MNMSRFRNLIVKNKKFILVLVAVGIYSWLYRAWVFNLGILTAGDWPYVVLPSQIDHYLSFLFAWRADQALGSISLDGGQALTYLPYGLLAKYFNIDFAIAERLIHFWPVLVITPLSAIILARTIFKSKLAIGISVAVYCLNLSFIFIETGWLTFAGAYALAPLVFLLFMRLLKRPSLKNAVITALVFIACSAYEPRVFLVLMWGLVVYAIFTIIVNKQ
jgi:hypothetical protein